MSDTSLIERDAQQMQLIPSSAMEPSLFAESESHGEFTAEILFTRHKDKYLAAVSFLAEGIGILRIASLLHISPNTVIAVREREGSAVDIERGRLARLSRAAARLCVEAIVDLLSSPLRVREVSARDLGILHGILVDKSELLSGGATARIEHTDSAPGHAELAAYLAGLRARASTGLEGETRGQKAIDVTPGVEVGPAGGVPAAFQVATGGSVSGMGVTDTQSDASGDNPQQTGGQSCA